MIEYETSRLILRDITLNDAALVEKYAGDEQVAKTTLNIPSPYPKGSAKDFITKSLEAQKTGKFKIAAIILKDTKELIGLINININTGFNRGELGYWIGRPYWRKGYGTEAAKRMLEIGFNEWELNRIYAQAFRTNPGSYRIMEKIGLKHEGVLKEHVKRFNQFHDVTVYGITKKGFQSTIELTP